MPELVEKNYIYYACAPLYKIKDGKKELYIETKKDYNAFINKRIVNKYDLYKRKDGERVKFTKSELLNLLSKYESYKMLIENLSLKLCCPTNVIENIALYHTNKNNLVKKISPLKVEEDNGCLLIKGLTEREEFVCVKVDDSVKVDLGKIVTFFKREVKSALLIYTSKDNPKARTTSLIEFLETVYEDCTPKYRQRFKGLTTN